MCRPYRSLERRAAELVGGHQADGKRVIAVPSPGGEGQGEGEPKLHSAPTRLAIPGHWFYKDSDPEPKLMNAIPVTTFPSTVAVRIELQLFNL